VAKIVVFIVLSVGLACVSRASLRVPRSHGFFRFFAWECIVALIILNIGHWFRDPLSLHQLISWLTLAASIALGVPGIRLLHKLGEPDADRRVDVPLLGVEKTTRLVTTGVFKYIRHPLYGSLLMLAWGAFFKDPSWASGGLVLCATTFLLATARVEEAENERYFGPVYGKYMSKTKMFIPFVL
jgi:protein-S-isoprenylcysteine O-methyltransferase Ste14